jgi:mono/diheme cytochrome c family protein
MMRLFMNRFARIIALSSLLMLDSNMVAAQDTSYIYGRSFAKPSGEDVFRNICQGCHMPNAMGATGAGTYPRLAGDPYLAAAPYPMTMVVFGSRAMPPLGAYLNDSQIANVVNYVRTHFGNHYTDMVKSTDVAKLRSTEKVDEEGNIIGRH